MPEERQLDAAIGPPFEPDYLRPAYANVVNINFTPHDFRLVFSQFVSPLHIEPEDVEAGRVEIRPQAVAQVIVPATIMHALIILLQTQFNNYLTQFGPPGMDPRGPGSEND